MNSFRTTSDVYSPSDSPFYLRGDHDHDHDGGRNGAHLEELQQSPGNGFQHVDAALYFSKISSVHNGIKATNPSLLSTNVDFNGVTNSLSPAEIGPSNVGLETGQFGFSGSGGAAAFQNWSTASGDKKQFPGIHHENLIALGSNEQTDAIIGDPKSLLKLAQNREAARKSRLKKKTYVQQLESSKQRLIEVEQNLQRVRLQYTINVRS
ncbi:hypothetical protein ACS0TY_008301 [Phlomoides rotata]